MVLTLAAARPESSHPLEQVEELFIQRDLPFDASIENELMAELVGSWCQYRLWYNWQEDIRVLVFSCAFDLRLPEKIRPLVTPLLARVNEKLWLGHFDLAHEDGAVMFRYSLLVPEYSTLPVEQLESLLDIAVTECDRFYPALQGFIWGNKSADDALALAMFETAGEA